MWVRGVAFSDVEQACLDSFAHCAFDLKKVAVDGHTVRVTSTGLSNIDASFICAHFDIEGAGQDVFWGQVQRLIVHVFRGEQRVFAKCKWFEQPNVHSSRPRSHYIRMNALQAGGAGDSVV